MHWTKGPEFRTEKMIIVFLWTKQIFGLKYGHAVWQTATANDADIAEETFTFQTGVSLTACKPDTFSR